MPWHRGWSGFHGNFKTTSRHTNFVGETEMVLCLLLHHLRVQNAQSCRPVPAVTGIDFNPTSSL